MPAHEDVEETDAHVNKEPANEVFVTQGGDVSTRRVKILLSRLSKHMADNLKKNRPKTQFTTQTLSLSVQFKFRNRNPCSEYEFVCILTDSTSTSQNEARNEADTDETIPTTNAAAEARKSTLSKVVLAEPLPGKRIIPFF